MQTERQAIAEKLQKDGETLSQDEIADMQRDIQEKGKDIRVHRWQRFKQSKVKQLTRFLESLTHLFKKFFLRLIAAKEVKVLLGRENVLFADTALDLTDDVTSMLGRCCS